MLAKKVTIRLATAQDAAVIKQMITGLADFQNHLQDVKASTSAIRHQMSQEKPPFECLLADVDGVAAGFALFYGMYSTWEARDGLFLEDLFVYPQFRGSGVGKGLLTALTDIACARGCTRLDWMVQNDNSSAQTFYANFGAATVPGWSRWRLELPAGVAQTF
jgi:GNAT superfamily N-acetyltransferase